jgi:hypothetical protein
VSKEPVPYIIIKEEDKSSIPDPSSPEREASLSPSITAGKKIYLTSSDLDIRFFFFLYFFFFFFIFFI